MAFLHEIKIYISGVLIFFLKKTRRHPKITVPKGGHEESSILGPHEYCGPPYTNLRNQGNMRPGIFATPVTSDSRTYRLLATHKSRTQLTVT